MADQFSHQTDSETKTAEVESPAAPGPQLSGVSPAVLQRKIQRRLQRKADGDNGVAAHAESAVGAASGSSGSALPETLQRKFEGSLGVDLSGVRVHTGAESAAANESVSAKAYTVGSDIHFGSGQYDPSSTAGQHLIAHEVAHTVQQTGGMERKAQFKLDVSEPGDAMEGEADSAADAMVAGQPTTVSGAAGLARSTLQRETKDDDPPTHATKTSKDDAKKLNALRELLKSIEPMLASMQSSDQTKQGETFDPLRKALDKVGDLAGEISELDYDEKMPTYGKTLSLTGRVAACRGAYFSKVEWDRDMAPALDHAKHGVHDIKAVAKYQADANKEWRRKVDKSSERAP